MDKRTYTPAIGFTRTDAERRDQELSWDRRDEAFFAAGACHILAFKFLERHPGEGYSIVYLRPIDSDRGHHVFVTDGIWAFDFNGWTLEKDLLEISAKHCRESDPNWSYELVDIEMDLEAFCRHFNHRPPDMFAMDPTDRTDEFLDSFDAKPVNGLSNAT